MGYPGRPVAGPARHARRHRGAEGALLAAVEEPPAAVVLDLLMPEINGFEFLKPFRDGAAWAAAASR